MRVLKQSTAVTVLLGPFLDKTDGVTEEAGLAGAGTEISKAGAAFGAGPVLGTLDSDGWYPIALTTTHTNTLGDLTVKVHDAATHLPVWMHFTVLPANVYDALVSGSDALQVHTNEITAGLIVAGTFGAGAINAAAIADGAIDAATFAAGAIDAAAIATGAIDADALAADAAAEIADAVWDEAVAGHVTGGTFGGDVAVVGDLGNLDVAVSTRLSSAAYTAPDNASIAAILDDTGTSGVVVAAGSKTGYALTVAEHAAVADKLLGRSIAGTADGGRTVKDALRYSRNKVEITGAASPYTITVYAEDDVTPAWTGAVTTVSRDAIASMDPA